ncbi:5012_t:CDS:2, partial [Cetraspora pellucida]
MQKKILKSKNTAKKAVKTSVIVPVKKTKNTPLYYQCMSACCQKGKKITQVARECKQNSPALVVQRTKQVKELQKALTVVQKFAKTIFAGYTIKVKDKQLELERKNGKEQKQIDELKKEENLQKETRSSKTTSVVEDQLKEKVKEGIKPSHLKRSRSLNDLSPNPEPAEIFYEAPENNPVKLKAKIKKKQQLEQDLESNINYGVKEIERLESETQSKNARLELRLMEEQNQEEKGITP